MKPTIRDVAREAGVSIATVSRVINGQDKVKRETRELIQQTIEKLNFRPNHAARTMNRIQTKTIGLIVPHITSEFWAQFAEAIETSLWEQGYTLIIGFDNFTDAKQKAILEIFEQKEVDGIIMGYTPPFFIENQLDRIIHSGRPVVALNSSTPKIHSVSVDRIRGLRNAINYLIQLGHRAIAYITYQEVPSDVMYVMSSSGIDTNDKLNVKVKMNDNFNEAGYSAAKQLLNNQYHFSAVFCDNDLLAMGAIRAFHENGLNVPNDISVVGYDDIRASALYNPSLTTVKQPIEKLGQYLAEKIIKLVHGELGEPNNIVLPLELVKRESTQSL
ncbi:LacI family DNA-binding transcriptional regulator [Paenibacillus polysaccharolyticus]|uniref:LacI family DNA-binding transcriptional regulator n=1 Tax=Paenibacillus polysaccharolyticus TaxID=582692 RepID=UPI00300AD615